MYAEGLGFDVLGQFENHDGFDGIILGPRDEPYHLEFTSERGRRVEVPPDPDQLLVIYLPDDAEWTRTCTRLETACARDQRERCPVAGALDALRRKPR
jgi:hypothetical protein